MKDLLSNNEPLTDKAVYAQAYDRFTEWKHQCQQQGTDPLTEYYHPEHVQPNWENADKSDYICRALSIIGIPKDIDPQHIPKLLKEYAERREKYTDVIQNCFRGVVNRLKELGIQEPETWVHAQNIFFVPQERIAKIAQQNTGDLAYILRDTTFREILIPFDSEEFSQNQDQLYDVIVHELLHRYRDASGKSLPHTVLEEGIVQSETRIVEKQTQKESKRSIEIYAFEAGVAKMLAEQLGVASLLDVDPEELRKRINEKYAIAGQISEPYDELLYDMRAYVKSFNACVDKIETESATDEEIISMKQSLNNKKEQFNRIWAPKNTT